MWQTEHECLALLELLTHGVLTRRCPQEPVYDALAQLPWTRQTRRRDQIGLVANRRQALVTLLQRVWPGWVDVLAELTVYGLPPTPRGWAQLMDARRADGLPPLPELLNRRTAASLTAPHAKATLTESRRAALGETETTHDGIVRLRPPAGLVARSPRGGLDLAAVAAVLGEVALPERAFREGLQLEGTLRAALLIENLGAWRDLPAPAGWLLVHVPGWDTPTALCLLDRLANARVVHFGDLDPNGVRIFRHLRERRPDLRWFIPPFWVEFIENHGQRTDWPEELDLAGVPPLVRELATLGLCLEQERIILEPRLIPALEELIEERACA